MIWLLDETVFPGFEGRKDEILVVAPCDDIDDIDVVTRKQRLSVRGNLRDLELGGPGISQLLIVIADHDQITQGRAIKARKMGGPRPAPSADDTNPKSFRH